MHSRAPFGSMVLAFSLIAVTGCAGGTRRVHAPSATPEGVKLVPATRTAAKQGAAATSEARISAPGGSGAGTRSVTPAKGQSGNETVGGLPAGSGAGVRG